MKGNYRAWEVAVDDYYKQSTEAEKLRFLLRFAVLAPSGHNTQPWNFSIRGNEILFYVNRERSLEGSDPKRRQLFIAFGCAVENLQAAAAHYGLRVRAVYFPEESDADLVARVSLEDGPAHMADHGEDLISAIPLRHTNRGKYAMEPLPDDFLKKIGSLAAGGQEVSVITNAAQRNSIADVVNDAQVEAMDDPLFREELSHFIVSSYTKRPTGMPGFALEIPAPISLFASRLIKKVNMTKQNRKKEDALLKEHTPAFIVISSVADSPNHWLDAGRLFERIWLLAVRQGLACSPLAAPIQSPEYAERLRELADARGYPHVFFRIGHPERQFRHSPRFSVDELMRDS